MTHLPIDPEDSFYQLDVSAPYFRHYTSQYSKLDLDTQRHTLSSLMMDYEKWPWGTKIGGKQMHDLWCRIMILHGLIADALTMDELEHQLENEALTFELLKEQELEFLAVLANQLYVQTAEVINETWLSDISPAQDFSIPEASDGVYKFWNTKSDDELALAFIHENEEYLDITEDPTSQAERNLVAHLTSNLLALHKIMADRMPLESLLSHRRTLEGFLRRNSHDKPTHRIAFVQAQLAHMQSAIKHIEEEHTLPAWKLLYGVHEDDWKREYQKMNMQELEDERINVGTSYEYFAKRATITPDERTLANRDENYERITYIYKLYDQQLTIDELLHELQNELEFRKEYKQYDTYWLDEFSKARVERLQERIQAKMQEQIISPTLCDDENSPAAQTLNSDITA